RPSDLGERVLGGLFFVSVQRSFGPDEVTLAERLSSLAALQVENAELYHRAHRAVRARDRVLGVVAHDLRNPLNTISMITTLLSEGRYSGDQITKQLNVVSRSVDRMDRLIQDLLDVTRLDSEQLVLDRAHNDPAALAKESVELNSALAATRSIELRTEIVGHPGPILADRERVI